MKKERKTMIKKIKNQRKKKLTQEMFSLGKSILNFVNFYLRTKSENLATVS